MSLTENSVAKLDVAMATSYFSFFYIESALVGCAVLFCPLQPLDGSLKWISAYVLLKNCFILKTLKPAANWSGLAHL